MNERLTRKTNNGYVPQYERETKHNYYDLVSKLGRLEDIEEELGIDLIAFVKLNKTCKIYDKEEEGFMDFDYIDIENKCLVCVDDFDEMSGGYLDFYYYFKDYGKTWALTKEELE